MENKWNAVMSVLYFMVYIAFSIACIESIGLVAMNINN